MTDLQDLSFQTESIHRNIYPDILLQIHRRFFDVDLYLKVKPYIL